ncbi:3-oxoacyl-[acyl-carrier-protein] synthase III C-terminal domain-containing protein [Phaeobacter sp. HF9A]|uniref:3-oxoacyl-[acyl-carrier-protein] synthase III C-terminal domain-containing protein n=1 Tax=Phaeobacter sp. HF9A TaxID=2721561 RepID=UPI00142FD9CE|nr:3-oxoacyl-[acyl-carrier-protein] synthase III C-terminal domain-containing protein [Phaeobacter sp. HF9A]NIZ12594.1 hypothetical protein [Phaeobacter sp. HF9A]
MLHILDIAIAYPERQEALSDLQEELSLSRDQMRLYSRFFGFEQFHCDAGEPLDEMIARASDAVLARNPDHDATLAQVVHCHTLPSTSPFNGQTSDILAPFRRRGLECQSATMNHCATGLSMLGVMADLLEEGQTGLILIGEKAFHPAIRVIENTTIMGEAAVAVPVGHTEGPYALLDTHRQHATKFWRNTGLRGENYLEGFDEAYLEFATQAISAAAARAGIALSDIARVMPHNVNAPSWYQIACKLGLASGMIELSTLGRFGHCFGADPFLNLDAAARGGRLSAGDRLLLFSIGLGATASAAFLEVR